ncbi:MAG TPA: hypothetical protein VG146_20370 [Verrucomicrobiae bacterium]|nr:hypothetical protein [Verrucomicrobiae bacterium]
MKTCSCLYRLMSNWRGWSGLIMVTCLFHAHAQQYSIDWYKISGGGGASSNGQYVVSGTIGQHDAGGPMTGGNYSLTGGFWSLVAAVQTPGAPLLGIYHTDTNTVVVYWPAAASSFTLQQSASLSSPGWGNVTATQNLVGTNIEVIVSPPVGTEFYRLQQ